MPHSAGRIVFICGAMVSARSSNYRRKDTVDTLKCGAMVSARSSNYRQKDTVDTLKCGAMVSARSSNYRRKDTVDTLKYNCNLSVEYVPYGAGRIVLYMGHIMLGV
ncbi:hypothetical protein BsWGS_25162 [Bradybaena similaris]